MIHYTIAETAPDLLGILQLQQANLSIHLSGEDILQQGFVTVIHSFTELEQLNNIERHVIAKDDERVVGYVLAMTKASKTAIPVLIPMFDLLDQLSYNEKIIASYDIMLIGQVCVDKNYRGQGVFDNLYASYKACFKDCYDFALTEIAVNNQRSINAHKRIGFREVYRYIAPGGVEWSLVIWPWNEPTVTTGAGS